MTIKLQSTSDSPEAVTAALGDLGSKGTAAETTEETTTEIEAKTDDESVEAETTEGETSETDETDDESEELETASEEETKGKPKKIGGFQKKIQKRDQRISVLEQENEFWRKEALRTQTAIDKKAAETVAPPVKEEAKPDKDKFATHDEYMEALTDWKVEQKLALVRKQDVEDKKKSAEITKKQTYHARAVAFAQDHDDFDEALNSVKTPMSPAVEQAIFESEVGPEIAYTLAKNPKEFERLCNLPYGTAMREMGKLEVKFSKPDPKTSVTTTATTTKAPKPVTMVRPRSTTTAKDISDPNLTQREYNRLREEQIKQNSMRR